MNRHAIPEGFDRTDWKAAPHLAWALRNTARILPTAAVERGARVRPLPRAAGAVAPQIATAHGAIDWTTYLETTHASSIIVCRDRAVIAEHHLLGAAPDDRHMVFSITKSVTGLVAAMLSHQGMIDEARCVRDYAPALAGTAFGAARIDALLAMTDGVAFDERYADPQAEIHRYSQAYWGRTAGGTAAALAALGERRVQPGAFAYRTPVADVIALVIARASGQTLPELVSRLIWSRMGAADGAAMVVDTAGRAIGGTGLCAQTADLARLGLLLCDEGRWGGEQIVPAAVVDRLFAGGDPGVFARDRYPERQGWSYAALWWHPGADRIAAIGVYGQFMMIDRRAGCVMVRTGAAPGADNTAMIPLHIAAFDAIARA